MNYKGPERRVHRVYVTRNSEYHVRSGVCVGVLNRRTDRWDNGHVALGRRMEGSLRFHEGGIVPNAGEPGVGDAIYFREGERDLITSKLERVDRPARAIVQRYPAGDPRPEFEALPAFLS